MGPQMATAAPMPNTYLSIMAAQSSNKPQPTTYAAIRYRRNAAMILGGTTGAAAAVVRLLPVGEAERSVISPVGSTGTSAVLLCQGCQHLVGTLQPAAPPRSSRPCRVIGGLDALVRRARLAVAGRVVPVRQRRAG